jgi:hemerythrin-like domain-containing protein
MDAITMLRDDHRSVEKLFKRFEDAGPRAFVEKRNVVDRIIEELSVHAAVEEQLFYPVTRATVPAVEQVALESLEEHHVVKWMLSELDGMDPVDERFSAKATVLIENVRHHVREEEAEYFREVRSELGGKALNELGEAMARARKTAPTRPHPRLSDTPPANIIGGTAMSVIDRIGNTASGLVQGGLAAAQDLVDRVRGREPRRSSPTGPRLTRRTARSIRGDADVVVDRVIASVLEAKASAQQVASDARSGAARTAKAARGGG